MIVEVIYVRVISTLVVEETCDQFISGSKNSLSWTRFWSLDSKSSNLSYLRSKKQLQTHNWYWVESNYIICLVLLCFALSHLSTKPNWIVPIPMICCS